METGATGYLYICIGMCVHVYVSICIYTPVSVLTWVVVTVQCCPQIKSQIALTNKLRLLNTCLQGQRQGQTALRFPCLYPRQTDKELRSGWEARHECGAAPTTAAHAPFLGMSPPATFSSSTRFLRSLQDFSEEHMPVFESSHRSERTGQSKLYRRFSSKS